MKHGTESFYNDFSRRLLRDYVYGNLRLESAIRHALAWMPPNARHILDVGCGIGWSSREICRHTAATVLGIDSSPRMVSLAQELFSGPRLQFSVADITEGLDDQLQFDAVVMLDVYEHIPVERRPGAHRVLKTSLADQGLIVLTYPSASHQRFLKRDHPDQLQPIDELVTPTDLERLAHDVDGEVVTHEAVTIWRPGDYEHAAILRADGTPSTTIQSEFRHLTVEPQQSRVARVRSRLGFMVTPSELLLPRNYESTICVMWPDVNAYSEQFIRAQVERMPANVELLHGGFFPVLAADNQPLPQSLLHGNWATRFIGRILTSQALKSIYPSLSRHVMTGSMIKYLKRARVAAVLAEFGPTGAAVTEVCSAVAIPLIVHFHGYDAYVNRILDEHLSAYRRMFEIAEAIVVVSRDMERQLLDLGAPSEKLHYNPYGADTTLFNGGNPTSVPPVFIAVGRFVEKKAPHLTLLAFAEVLQEIPEARLVMIGEGALLEACKQLARGLEIAHAVDFQGSKRYHSDVAAAMRGARAFVQHSMRTTSGDSEGTPVSVIEAGAMGLPVVATRHGGIPEVVIDDETGFLVDEGDVQGMAERMLSLARKPQLAERLGTAARRRICIEFSIERSVGNLWRIIKDAIDGYRGD